MSDRPLIKNAADRAQVKEGEKRERYRAARDADDIRKILGMKEGRRFIWRLLSITGVEHICFTPDPIQTAFNLGERNVGNRVKGMVIETDERAYLLMQQEMFSEKSKEDAPVAAKEDDEDE